MGQERGADVSKVVVVAAFLVGGAGLLGGGLAAGLYLADREENPPQPVRTVSVTEAPEPEPTPPGPDPEKKAARATCRAIDQIYSEDLKDIALANKARAITVAEGIRRLEEAKQEYREANFDNDCYALGF